MSVLGEPAETIVAAQDYSVARLKEGLARWENIAIKICGTPDVVALERQLAKQSDLLASTETQVASLVAERDAYREGWAANEAYDDDAPPEEQKAVCRRIVVARARIAALKGGG